MPRLEDWEDSRAFEGVQSQLVISHHQTWALVPVLPHSVLHMACRRLSADLQSLDSVEQF